MDMAQYGKFLMLAMLGVGYQDRQYIAVRYV